MAEPLVIAIFELLVVEKLLKLSVKHVSATSGSRCSGRSRMRIEVDAHTEIVRG